MRLLWMIIAVSLLSNCAFVDGLHNQQQNIPDKSNALGKTLPSPVTKPEHINNQNNPTTNAAKMVTPLIQ